MSLKAFHIFFIIISLILTVGVGFWGVRSYMHTTNMTHLIVGILSFISSILLFFYLKYVLKKYKDISLLMVMLSVIVGYPQDALACSVCYGDPNSQIVKGLNMAVLSLLIIIVVVLSLFAALIFSFRKRAKLVSLQDSAFATLLRQSASQRREATADDAKKR